MNKKEFLKPAALIALSLSFLLITMTAPVHAKDREYYIYGDAMPGTKFKEKIFTSSIPLDKPYAKLSKKHQNYVRRPYDGMPETETPPFPSKGLGTLIEPLIRAHSAVLRNGSAVAIAMIGADGKTKSVEVLDAPSKKMADFITVLFFDTPFDPATCDGKHCDMEYLLQVDMKVRAGNF